MTLRISLAVGITIATLFAGVIVWSVRVEGRVDGHDRELADLEQHHNADVAQIRADLTYVRDRLDRFLERPAAAAPTSGTSESSQNTPAMQLKVRPLVGLAPSDVELRVHVEPGGRAREVLLELAGPMYSSSRVNVRRDPTAPTLQPPIWIRSVPAGEYVAVATLTDLRCDGCSSRVVLARREQRLEIRPRFGG